MLPPASNLNNSRLPTLPERINSMNFIISQQCCLQRYSQRRLRSTRGEGWPQRTAFEDGTGRWEREKAGRLGAPRDRPSSRREETHPSRMPSENFSMGVQYTIYNDASIHVCSLQLATAGHSCARQPADEFSSFLKHPRLPLQLLLLPLS